MGGALVYSRSLMPVRRCPPLVHPLVPRLLLDPPRCPPEMFDCAKARLRVALRCRSLGIDLRLIGSSRHALRQVAIRKPRIKMARLVARSLRATTLRTSRSWHSSTTWLLRKSKNECSDLRTTHPTFVPSNSRHDPGSFARRAPNMQRTHFACGVIVPLRDAKPFQGGGAFVMIGVREIRVHASTSSDKVFAISRGETRAQQGCKDEFGWRASGSSVLHISPRPFFRYRSREEVHEGRFKPLAGHETGLGVVVAAGFGARFQGLTFSFGPISRHFRSF